MKILTLSFLTESKASHACLSSIRQVAIALLVMLLTTASVWAQEVGGGTLNISTKVTPENVGTVSAPTEAKMGTQVQFTVTPADGYKIKNVSLSDPSIYSLVGSPQTGIYSFTIGSADVTITAEFEEAWTITFYANGGLGTMPPVLVGKGKQYTIPECSFTGNLIFKGWSMSALGEVEYLPWDKVTMNNNLKLYAIWDYPLTYTITNEEKKQVELGYEGDLSTGILNIPATVTINGIEYSVTSIGGNAFRNCFNLQSVTIPNSVTSIGDFAFADCPSIQSVTIPESVTSIGDNAFRGCSDLQSITIPNSVTSIGYNAFAYCHSLQSVTIYGNPNIGTDAFREVPATVAINLTASQIGNDYWTTFYNDGYNFQTDEYTKVYKGTVNESSLMLTEVEDKIVNSGTAVILKSSGNPVMTLTETGSSDTNGNDLRGISGRFSRISIIRDFKVNEIYTMGNTSAGFGFHRYTGEYVPTQKAFLPLNIENEAGAKAQSLTIVFANETTGINSVSSDSNVQNDWFTLDGTRLSGKPTLPGIYINGKKKIAIK